MNFDLDSTLNKNMGKEKKKKSDKKLTKDNFERIKDFFQKELDIILSGVFKSRRKKLALFILLFIIFSCTFALILGGFQIKDITESIRTVDFDIYLSIFVFLGSTSLTFIILLSSQRFLKKIKIPTKAILFYVILSVIFMFLIVFLAYYKKHPQFSYTIPNNGGYIENYNEPIVVKINVPVRKDKLKPSIVPDLFGRWEWESYLGNDELTRTGKFYITETPFPESRFIAYIAGINKLTDNVEHEYGFELFAVKTPQIVSSYPEKDQVDFDRNKNLTFEFDTEIKNLIDYDVSIEPNIDFEIVPSDPKIIEIRPNQTLAQNAEYILTLTLKPKSVMVHNNELNEYSTDRIIHEFKFTTTKEPLVNSFNPSGEVVRVEDKLKVEFAEEMNKQSVESNFVLDPFIEGTFVWDDDQTMTYDNSSEFERDTQYKVVFKAGTLSKKGGTLENDLEFQFKTIGKVSPISFFPEYQSTYVDANTNIAIELNQEVDKEDAQAKFSISPAVTGDFGWDGNKLVFDPHNPLDLSTTYTVTLQAGVKSLYGTDSDQPMTFFFTTRPRVYAFDVPIYYQQTSFSCNIYTAIMIMAWKGIGADATSLISEIGYNDRRENDQWVGNPYVEYVGTADGDWGYGVYAPPIQRVLAARGISTEARTSWNVSDLAATVEQGHPVIIWRYNGVGGGQNISWTAEDGTYVYAFNGMHGSIVTGFQGNPSNPESFYISDPWLGRLWLDRATFDAYWSYSGRSAVIVY